MKYSTEQFDILVGEEIILDDIIATQIANILTQEQKTVNKEPGDVKKIYEQGGGIVVMKKNSNTVVACISMELFRTIKDQNIYKRGGLWISEDYRKDKGIMSDLPQLYELPKIEKLNLWMMATISALFQDEAVFSGTQVPQVQKLIKENLGHKEIEKMATYFPFFRYLVTGKTFNPKNTYYGNDVMIELLETKKLNISQQLFFPILEQIWGLQKYFRM